MNIILHKIPLLCPSECAMYDFIPLDDLAV